MKFVFFELSSSLQKMTYFLSIFQLAKSQIHVFLACKNETHVLWAFSACKKKNEIHVFWVFLSLKKMKSMILEWDCLCTWKSSCDSAIDIPISSMHITDIELPSEILLVVLARLKPNVSSSAKHPCGNKFDFDALPTHRNRGLRIS